MLFLSSLAVIFLVGFLGVIQLTLSSESSLKDSNLSPLESGFESLKTGTLISAPFFFLAILFVLFDLELVLLFPGVVSITKGVILSLTWVLVLMVVLVTLLYEWMWCGLKWQV